MVMKLLGAIIAGGQSRRFGSDKAIALLRGEPLIAHAMSALRPLTSEIVVCGRPWPGVVSLSDRPAPDLGPLGGINAALSYAQAGGFASVLTIGCDMPDVPQALLAELIAACPSFAADAPILGCWPSHLAGALDDHLAAGDDRSIRRWARAIEAAALRWHTPLANVNTPADLPGQ